MALFEKRSPFLQNNAYQIPNCFFDVFMSMSLNKEHSARAAGKLDLLKIVTIYLSVENKLQSADLLYILSQRGLIPCNKI